MTEPSTVPREADARAGDYIGLFLVALATLMLEILLTRIFSVTLWYHLAFVAVSIAMFGMTLGAVVVYLGARWFRPARAWLNLGVGSALFAISSVASIALHLRMASDPRLLSSALFDLSRAYVLVAVPFVFSGIVISIALTQFPRQIGRLYAADLAGAALGCVVLIGVLDWVGGPLSVVVVGAIAGLAAVVFALGSSRAVPMLRRFVLAGSTIAVLSAAAWLVVTDPEALMLHYAKGAPWPTPIYEKWNSHSRVAVVGDRWEAPFGWGLSRRFRPRAPVRQLHLNIDASAETVMTQFRDEVDVDHLRYDVTNVGLHLRRGGSVYVIGAGGGRDVLSALTFDARRVVAVELNRSIIDALNGRFGEVTGHLDRRPGVEFVNDEARSYLSRTDERFDFIQISLIDTWAATAAGAFALSENTLYTVDAWRTFLRSLTDRGIVSVSRWYSWPDPLEVYKTVGLATASLREEGVTDTRRHLMVVAQIDKPEGQEDAASGHGVATLLVSRSPFADADVDQIERVASEMDFEVALSPRRAINEAFARVADAARLDRFIADAPIDLAPPDDDRPFFFRLDKRLLNGLLLFVATLAAALIVIPVVLKADAGAIVRGPMLSLAFLAIGLGFMLVEIAQMMRLTLLLGHPTFSLSVVLFGMLLSSGAGSFAVSRVSSERLEAETRRRLLMLIAVLLVLGVATPVLVRIMHTAPTPLRVATALALLTPAGFLMGMAFPLAMTIAARQQPTLTAWFWGVNGAASVCASVIAVTIATSVGIGAAWWTGVLCYVVAALALARSARSMS